MAENANSYSFAGLADLTLGANGKVANNFGAQALLGNDITGTYYAFFGGPEDQLNGIVGTAPDIAERAMGQPLTFGRNTSEIVSLNIARKGGLPQALSSGTRGFKSFMSSWGGFKTAADVGFTIAEALGCLGPND
jgi:hypothetical protein